MILEQGGRAARPCLFFEASRIPLSGQGFWAFRLGSQGSRARMVDRVICVACMRADPRKRRRNSEIACRMKNRRDFQVFGIVRDGRYGTMLIVRLEKKEGGPFFHFLIAILECRNSYA